MQDIEQYIKRKFSVIPLQKNSKLPLIKWKPYQTRKADNEEIFSWYMQFGEDINKAIVTGSLSKMISLDCDDQNQLPKLIEMIPEIQGTTKVRTPTEGHYQFYFSTNGDKIRSRRNFLGLGIELKGEGSYVVCPDSIINGVRYKFERPLTCILPIPKVIIEDFKTVITGELELPRIKARCVEQILNYNLEIGQRKKAYHIAYCKMRQEGHKKSYVISLCKLANRRLEKPLREDEFDFGKIYYYGCPLINKELNFVDCSNCLIRGGLKVRSLQMRSIHKLKGLTNTQRAILSILDTYFRGYQPTIYEIQKYSDTNINYYTIKDALEVLKEKGII